MFRVNLFGEFQLTTANGQPLKLATRRAQLLLAYLLLNQKIPIAREKLVDIFWPDATEAKGRQILRQTLYLLRNTFEKKPEVKGRFFHTDNQNIRFESENEFEIDTAQFEAALKQAALESEQVQIDALKKAVELYRGDLLQGCYEDWAFELQEYFRNQYLQAVNQLADAYSQIDQLDKAIEAAKRSLHIDALQEDIHRTLMQLYLNVGNRAAALKQYQDCEQVLSDELSMEPLPETQQFYQDIVNRSAEVEVAQAEVDIESFRVLDSPFVNRAEELKSLSTYWASALKGNGQSVMIGGEAGIGKTRLIGELELLCFKQDAITLRGRNYEFESQMPLQAIAEAIRNVIPSLLDQELNSLAPRVMDELVVLNPSFADLFPKARTIQMLANPEQQKTRTFENLTEFFLQIAKHRPVFLFMDDLQWADRLTLEFLHYLIRHMESTSMLLLGAYRVEEVHDLHPLVEMMDALTKDRKLNAISLKPLENSHVSDMVEGILQNKLAPDWTSHLLSQAQGIPFFVEELVKTSIESGVLQKAQKGQWQVREEKHKLKSIPSSVEALVNQRRRRLSRTGRQMLDMLSVSAYGLSADEIRSIMPGAASDLYEPLEELSQTHFLLEEGNQYRYRHDLLRQAVYGDLSSEKRRHFHAVLGEGLESFYQDHTTKQDSFSIVKLAHHFNKAENWKKALSYSLDAGKLVWEKQYAKDEAIELFNQALEIAEHTENDYGIMSAYKGLGQVCVTTDEQDLGFDYCQKALSLCGTPEDRAEIYGYIASVYHHKREMEKGLEYCKKAIEELGHKSELHLTAKLYSQAASFLNWIRQYKEAILYCQKALNTIDKKTSPDLYAQALSYLGHAYSGMKDFDKAVESQQLAAQIAEEIDDPLSIGRAYFHLGIGQYENDNINQSIKSWNISLDQMQNLSGQHDAVSVIINRMIYAYLRLNDLDKARILAFKQLEEAKKSDNLTLLACSYVTLGCFEDILKSDDSNNYFNLGLKMEPENAIVLITIIKNYLYLDDANNAIKWFLKCKSKLRKRDFEFLKSLPTYTKAIKIFHDTTEFKFSE